jgi:type IV secretion system protein VirB4
VTKLTRIIKDHEESGAMSSLVSVQTALDDQTFLTKGGDLVTVMRVHGVDHECLDADQLDLITRRFESALRVLDDTIRLYQYLVKRDSPPIPSSTYDNVIVRKAAESRSRYFDEKADKLFTLNIYFALVYESPGRGARRFTLFNALQHPALLGEIFSTAKTIAALDAETNRAKEILDHKVMSFIAQLSDTVQIEVLDKQAAFGFFRELLNYSPWKAESVRMKYDAFVDFQACDSSLECYRDHLRLDDHYVKTLTLKNPPGHTSAHLFEGLQRLHCSYIAVSEWKREFDAKVRGLIRSKRRHLHNSKASLMNYLPSNAPTSPKDMLIDDSAVAHVGDLGHCLEELDVDGRSFGRFSLTLVLYDQDLARLKRSVSECFKIFGGQDAQLTEETYNLLNSWLAVLPGNSAYNLRQLWLLDTNCADMSFLFAPNPGETENKHLGAEYLATLETNYGTPYYFNLHYQDIAHSLVLGGSGSGKSFTLNFLLTNLQKYAPFTFVFDIGGSYQSLTKLFQGGYLRVGTEDRSFTINPFVLPPTPDNLQFLFSFVKVLIESNGDLLTAQDERDLYEQIQNLYAVEPSQRRLLTLSNMLSRRLRSPLQKWVQGGQYGWLFDNAEDNLTFARFQTFDFEGMDQVAGLLEPLLFYILHRASAVIDDEAHLRTLKVFVLDEAWRFLRHPTIRLYMVGALKTWRKKNAAMILATQSTEDLLQSEMLSVAVESCVTKLFLASPDIDAKVYREIFHLNETEARWITRLLPKQQILVKRPDQAKVVNLNVDPMGYWLYTSNPYDRERRREAFEKYGFEQGLEILTRSAS